MRRWLFLCGLLALVPALRSAAQLAPETILEQSDRARGKLPGLVWQVEMTSVEGGKPRTQTLQVKARGQDVLATFLSPPRVKNQKLLMVGRNMWFIKPNVSKPVPISPRQKLMGQAANGDIASTNYSGDYAGELIGDEEINGEMCYVLDLSATDKNVTYDKIRYWVSKGRLVGVKADFFTVSGKKFKTAEFEYGNSLAVQEDVIPFISQMRIQDAIRPDEVTTLSYSAIEPQDLPDSTFKLNLLMR
ncbi:MAG: outer membrane lipoprotein-sorting protein [Deferrisomatales bacterium]|nr:outer membrane lipoprotein-sorting protein [Deferrisomatales bacterium]